jgi:hypothetical protein
VTTLVQHLFNGSASIDPLQEFSSFKFSDSAVIQTTLKLDLQATLQALGVHGELRQVERLAVNTYRVRYFDCRAVDRLELQLASSNTAKTQGGLEASFKDPPRAILPLTEANAGLIYLTKVNAFRLKQAASGQSQADKENLLIAK